MTADHLANEAKRLKTDELFNKALDDIKRDALDALMSVNAENAFEVMRLQERARMTDEIRSMLERYILAAPIDRDRATPYA